MNPDLGRGGPSPGGGQANAPETAPVYPVKRFPGREEITLSPAPPTMRVSSSDFPSMLSRRSTEAVRLRSSRLDSHRRSTDSVRPWVCFSVSAEIIATITSPADA